MLEGLGTFGFTISSTPADTLNDFTAANIKSINVVFTPAAELQELIADAKFVPVPSRLAQAAVLKAEKNGEASVDMEALKKKGTVGGGSTSDSPNP